MTSDEPGGPGGAESLSGPLKATTHRTAAHTFTLSTTGRGDYLRVLPEGAQGIVAGNHTGSIGSSQGSGAGAVAWMAFLAAMGLSLI